MPSTEYETRQRSIAIDGRMIYQDQCDGIARVTIELIRHLPPDRATDVTLILAEGRSSRFDVGDLSGHVKVRYTSSDVGRPYDVSDLRRVLASLNAGVFYSPYHALAPLHVPCPLVVGIHDCILEADPRLCGRWPRSVAYRLNTERVLRQAVAVIAPSEATAQHLPVFYRRIPPLFVCPNGVATPKTSYTDQQISQARIRLGLPEHYILNVSARRPHKNQGVLLKALALMDTRARLVLVGHGDHRAPDSLEDLATQLGVRDRVLVIERVSDEDLGLLYACASVFAFPSTAEGFGLPPLEAMAAGLPVVASAIPAIAEVCGQAAVLVSPFSRQLWAQALTSLLESPSTRARMSEQGRAVAASASWSTASLLTYRLLRQVATVDRISKPIEGLE